ncbi:hypothetical protein CALCODRAFT_553824 [Calocera cornea HHB12733]|uniref:Enoyl reductase (ER) domain-containing protein n=1 Tax=Calocera cornea HHB12733 TaxID=1353952 RepID=A0A165I684_9BASI|nr:hypothetical protein CALCODRAFT_553824 [Calocera cornea HHB12733]
MPRPTLLQNILGRPTRSYQAYTHLHDAPPVYPLYDPGRPQHPPREVLYKGDGRGWNTDTDMDMDMSRKDRRDIASTLGEVGGPPTPQALDHPTSLAVHPQGQQQQQQHPQEQQHPQPDRQPATVADNDSDSNSDSEQFYTPPQSPPASPSTRTALLLPPPQPHPPQNSMHPLRLSSTNTNTTTTATATGSEDAYSNYSWSLSASISSATTPSPAVSRNPSVSKIPVSLSVPLSAPATRQAQLLLQPKEALQAPTAPAFKAQTAPGPPMQEPRKRRRASSAEPHREAHPEWAKDVRWLVPPPYLQDEEPKRAPAKQKQKPTRPREREPGPGVPPPASGEEPALPMGGTRSRALSRSTSSASAGTATGPAPTTATGRVDRARSVQEIRGLGFGHAAGAGAGAGQRAGSTSSNASTMGTLGTLGRSASLSASPASAGSASGRLSRASSSSLRSAPTQAHAAPFPTPLQPAGPAPLHPSTAQHSIPDPAPTPAPRPRPRAHSLRTAQLMAQLRMSDVPEMDEEVSDALFAGVSVSVSAPGAPGAAASESTSRPSSRLGSQTPMRSATPIPAGPPVQAPGARLRTSSAPSRPLSTASSAPTHRSHASSYSTVLLPSPLPIPPPLSATTQQGYTSLTLPRAQYVPDDPVKAATAGRVDVGRMGIGQAAMATVSVVRGAARRGLFRRASRSLTRGESPSRAGGTAHALAFSVRTAPPTRVPPSSALVRVFACALDTLDALLLRAQLVSSDPFGYTPGRALVGHVVEAGWDCPGVSKGDWVLGLLDSHRPGALAEFVLLDKRRMHPCPPPSAQLNLQHLAVLALSGVPAYRAARTASELPPDARVLVLLGACAGLGCAQGVLCARMLVAQGCAVSVQIQGEGVAEGVSRLCEADEVWEGELLRCLDSLAEHLAGNDGSELEKERERFHLVLDCVGGRDVWRAARGVLKDHGQFTTLVGDFPGVAPTLRASIHSNLRSLRRAFLTPSASEGGNPRASAISVASSKVDKAKRIEYEWVSPLHAVDREGEDVRDSLEAVVKSARDGVGVPFLSLSQGGGSEGELLDGVQVVTMENAAEAIERLDESGGIVVVKVAG